MVGRGQEGKKKRRRNGWNSIKGVVREGFDFEALEGGSYKSNE